MLLPFLEYPLTVNYLLARYQVLLLQVLVLAKLHQFLIKNGDIPATFRISATVIVGRTAE